MLVTHHAQKQTVRRIPRFDRRTRAAASQDVVAAVELQMPTLPCGTVTLPTPLDENGAYLTLEESHDLGREPPHALRKAGYGKD